MSPDLEKKFLSRWPKWFEKHHSLDPNPKGPFYPIWFGIECGDGWFDILWKLCEAIEPLVREGFTIDQIKEKFGGLRFYVDGATDEVYELISKTEELSYKTCEGCGKPGKPNAGGWIITLCDECRKKHEEGKLDKRDLVENLL